MIGSRYFYRPRPYEELLSVYIGIIRRVCKLNCALGILTQGGGAAKESMPMRVAAQVLDELVADCETSGDVEKIHSQMLQRIVNRSLEAEMRRRIWAMSATPRAKRGCARELARNGHSRKRVQSAVARQLGQYHSVLPVPARNQEGDLYYQRDRIAQYGDEQAHAQSPYNPQRRCGAEILVPLHPRSCEELESDPSLEACAAELPDHVRRRVRAVRRAMISSQIHCWLDSPVQCGCNGPRRLVSDSPCISVDHGPGLGCHGERQCA